MNTNTANPKTKRLVESALMIALGTILSFLQFPGPWVNGGSITAFSMLPICFISYKYGVKWGVFTGGVHGLLQMMLGISGLRGISLITFIGAVFLDYLLAFAALGVAGAFKNVIRNMTTSFVLGTILALFLRFTMHFLSGFLLWGSLIDDGFAAITTSFVYNIGYMGPEIIITAIGAFALSVTPLLKTQCVNRA